ncbi:MAG: hypothetical protein ACYCV7_09945 [Acidimicrobiales bacterium]
MSGPAADEFYSTADEAPQQGDIFLAAVARIVADDDFTPQRWRELDEVHAELAPPLPAGALTLPALRVAAGRALVMVTTHDCGMDKEFNAVVDALVDPVGPGLEEAAAVVAAEERVDLDRSLQVSPLIDPATVEVSGIPVDQGLLMSGRIVGYLPIPALVIDGTTLIPEAVVDLNYRTTLDRLAYAQRLSCVSETARERLRYALARLDVLRTPTLEAQLSDAVGQRVVKARVHKKNQLVVQLTLEDGSVLELLKRPGSPPAGPTSRTRRSVP